MRIQDCVLSIDVAVFAPVVRNQPEDCWVEARNSGAIPPEIYGLYQRAGFLSFGSGSRFLGDDENILFSYFSMTLNCLMEMLTDAKEQLAEFVKDHNLTYDLGKKARGEPWEPAASTRAQRLRRQVLPILRCTYFFGCGRDRAMGLLPLSRKRRYFAAAFARASSGFFKNSRAAFVINRRLCFNTV